MARAPTWFDLFALGLLVGPGMACTKPGADDPSRAPTPMASASASALQQPAPILVAQPGAPHCEGLEKTACVLKLGCILDQPSTGSYVCRAAKNDCERAVRHADLIGRDVASVSEAEAKSAAARCTASPGCVVAGGKCACTCSVFANCDCVCGGGWLPRCVPNAEASSLEGFPTKRH